MAWLGFGFGMGMDTHSHSSSSSRRPSRHVESHTRGDPPPLVLILIRPSPLKYTHTRSIRRAPPGSGRAAEQGEAAWHLVAPQDTEYGAAQVCYYNDVASYRGCVVDGLDWIHLALAASAVAGGDWAHSAGLPTHIFGSHLTIPVLTDIRVNQPQARPSQGHGAAAQAVRGHGVGAGGGAHGTVRRYRMSPVGTPHSVS